MMSTTVKSVGIESFYQVICASIMCSNPDQARNICAPIFQALYLKTQHELDAISTGSKSLLVILYSIIAIMSLVGNSLVVITFAFDKHMRSVTNVFILSLAVADLMVTLTCVPINLGSAFASHWLFGGFACKLVPFFMTFSVAFSSLTLCSIALDRYFAIVHPHKLKCLQKPAPATIFLVLIWVVSLICSVPNAVFYSLKKIECRKSKKGEDIFMCVWPDNVYKLPLELWLTLVVLFFIPLVIMSTTYGLIGYHLWIRKSIGGSRRNSLRNADMKKSVIKMLVIVMLAFIVCWSPIMVLNSVEKMLDSAELDQTVMAYLKLYFQCLGMASCCINPVIYTFMNKKFREKFTKYLLCCRRRRVGALAGSNDTQIIARDQADSTVGAKTTQRMSMGNIMPRTC